MWHNKALPLPPDSLIIHFLIKIKVSMRANNFILRIMVAFTFFTTVPFLYAWEQPETNIRIIFTLVDFKPEPNYPRTPIEPPLIEQMEHTLFFFDGNALLLNIYSMDEWGDETLEYSTSVSATTTSVQLPICLFGTYLIEIVRDGLYFRGEIEL